ncbi:unnamed protein product [Chrysodeixis includens]|uniref:FAST kinase-like protein subdomain 2 domain-containing protein n=1 Tax=Chrysodeixis includens TaxID=689277 RepID=A0A9N8KSR4_CHRIL|nr:unnamed protein product [Chrysodeixis includens]
MQYRHEPVLSAIADWLQRHIRMCRASTCFRHRHAGHGGLYAPDKAGVALLKEFVPVPLKKDSDELRAFCETALTLKEEEDEVFVVAGHGVLAADPRQGGEAPLDPRCSQSSLISYCLLATWDDILDPQLEDPNPMPSQADDDRRVRAAYCGQRPYPRLPEHVAGGVPVVHAKDKAQYVQGVMDTFKSLVSADAFLKRECNSGMGFLYDAEFAVDAKCHPVPLEKACIPDSCARTRLPRHDAKDSRPARHQPTLQRLLELKGFKVLQIPYTEFNPKDKLLTRVQYIEKRLKELVSSKQA